MLNYMEFLNLPATVLIILVAAFALMQGVGILLDFKGKVVPEFMNLKKYFARKKKERETMEQIPAMIENFEKLLNSFESHYSADNIAMRDGWMSNVNNRLDANDEVIKELIKKLDKNNSDTLQILVDSKRNEIINFASEVTDKNREISREKFNRIFKLHEEYEQIIEENGLTNGEVDIAFRIITESYKEHLQDRTFLEDLRKYY